MRQNARIKLRFALLGGERGTVAEQVLTAFRGMSVTPDDSQVNSSDRLTTVISIIKI